MGSLPFAFPEQILFAYFGKEANQLIDLISGKQSLQSGQIWLMVFDVVVGVLLFVGCVVFGRFERKRERGEKLVLLSRV
jgi:hypothetical protein